jgi:hypothetical protein
VVADAYAASKWRAMATRRGIGGYLTSVTDFPANNAIKTTSPAGPMAPSRSGSGRTAALLATGPLGGSLKADKPEPDQHKRRRSDEEQPLYDVHDPSLSQNPAPNGILRRWLAVVLLKDKDVHGVTLNSRCRTVIRRCANAADAVVYPEHNSLTMNNLARFRLFHSACISAPRR